MIDIAHSTLVCVIGLTAMLAAVGVILCASPVYSALFLICNMVGLALLFLLYNAEFIAVVQIIVYAGAVMILFLFIIALLGSKKESSEFSIEKLMALGFVPVLFGELLLTLTTGVTKAISGQHTVEAVRTLGSAKAIGAELFSRHLVPFELASVLLLVATAGIICLAKFPLRQLRRRAR